MKLQFFILVAVFSVLARASEISSSVSSEDEEWPHTQVVPFVDKYIAKDYAYSTRYLDTFRHIAAYSIVGGIVSALFTHFAFKGPSINSSTVQHVDLKEHSPKGRHIAVYMFFLCSLIEASNALSRAIMYEKKYSSHKHKNRDGLVLKLAKDFLQENFDGKSPFSRE